MNIESLQQAIKDIDEAATDYYGLGVLDILDEVSYPDSYAIASEILKGDEE